MTYSTLILALITLLLPALVTGLACFQCESKYGYKRCTSHMKNLQPCDEGDICYTMSSTWRRKPFVMRGCNSRDNLTMDCGTQWNYCELDLKAEVNWTCHGRRENSNSKFKFKDNNLSRNSPRKGNVIKAADVTFCYCDSDGCNYSLTLQPLMFFIIWMFSMYFYLTGNI